MVIIQSFSNPILGNPCPKNGYKNTNKEKVFNFVISHQVGIMRVHNKYLNRTSTKISHVKDWHITSGSKAYMYVCIYVPGTKHFCVKLPMIVIRS